MVFSCSLLHEATPITRGRRFAFLPFLYDEAAAEIRRQNLSQIGDEALRSRIESSILPAPTAGERQG